MIFIVIITSVPLLCFQMLNQLLVRNIWPAWNYPPHVTPWTLVLTSVSLLHFQSWIGLNSCCLWISAFRIMGLVIDTDDLSCLIFKKKKKSPLQPFLQVVSTLGYGPLLVAFVIWKTFEWNSTQIHLWEKFQQWAPSKLKCLARIMVPKADLFSLLQVGSSPCF